MQSVKGNLSIESRSLQFASDVARQARDIGMPIILYWIGWLFVAYFLIYFISVYVGPALFNTSPYYFGGYGGRPYWKRNSQFTGQPNPYPMNVPLRQRRGAIAHMDEDAATDLTARVTRAI